MAELKTKVTELSVNEFIDAIEDDTTKRDCKTLLKMMKRVTGEKPKLWMNNTVGFGTYHYKSERSAQQGEWYITGFSPRKANLSLHLMAGFEQHHDLMQKLGKHKVGKGCLYIKKLDDVDVKVLEELVAKSVEQMRKTFVKV